MKLLERYLYALVVTILCFLIPHYSLAQNISLPSIKTPEGYLASLLINEVPFPGEHGYVSEEDTKAAMRQILAVLVNRIENIPDSYIQQYIAGVSTTNILMVITAGGKRGQVDGFYFDSKTGLAVVERVTRRITYLTSLANKGTPGRFARLLNYAVSLATDYYKIRKTTDDLYKNISRIGSTPVTGYGYSWMTDSRENHPRGNFITIPDTLRGSLGRNRFFTLRKNPL